MWPRRSRPELYCRQNWLLLKSTWLVFSRATITAISRGRQIFLAGAVVVCSLFSKSLVSPSLRRRSSSEPAWQAKSLFRERPKGTISSPEAEVAKSGQGVLYGFSDGGVFIRWACP